MDSFISNGLDCSGSVGLSTANFCFYIALYIRQLIALMLGGPYAIAYSKSVPHIETSSQIEQCKKFHSTSIAWWFV